MSGDQLMPVYRYADEVEKIGALGSGGYGSVFLMRNKRTLMYFARKVANLESYSDMDMVESELRTTEQLSKDCHPNIVQVLVHRPVLDDGHLPYWNSLYFLDLELCDINLAEYLEGTEPKIYRHVVWARPSIQRVHGLSDWVTVIEQDDAVFFIVALMQQLLSALRFIHSKDLVHRDLTPSNGCWKLADFGLSAGAKTQSLRMSNNRRGTSFYMAPELMHEWGFNKLSDIWSLGCILFEVCSGRKAFPYGYIPSEFVALEPEELVFGDWIGDDARPTFKTWIFDMLRGQLSERPSVGTLGERFNELFSLITNLPLPPETSILLAPQHHIGTDTFCRRSSLRIESVLPPLGFYNDYLALGETLNGFVTARKLFLGVSHRKTVWSILNLAWVYYHTGFEEEADKCFKEALSVMKVFNFEQRDMFSARNGIASLLVEQKQFTEGLKMWEALLESQQLEAEYDAKYSDLLSSLHGINWTRLQRLTSEGHDNPTSELSDVDNHTSELSDVIDQMETLTHKYPGLDCPDALSANLLLASGYSHMDAEGAGELYSRALPELNKIFGPWHLDTLLCRSELAWTYVLRDQPHKAIPIFEEILSLQQKKGGDGYADETMTSLEEAKQLLIEMNAPKSFKTARAPRKKRWGSQRYDSDLKASLWCRQVNTGRFSKSDTSRVEFVLF